MAGKGRDFCLFGAFFLLIKTNKKKSLIWGSWPTVGGRGVGPMRGLGTGYVTGGPMIVMEQNVMGRKRQTRTKTDIVTYRLNRPKS